MNEVRIYNDREWLWPSADYHCWKHLTEQHPSVPDDILEIVGKVHTVVQAGGNCGLYTAAYAKHVNHVITFCLLYTSPSPRDPKTSRMPSSA